jgi:hypothetical protein
LLDAEGYPEEGSDSYYENARGKALFGREVGRAEAWMLGEDSGLEVEALGGAPGIRSARYAPEGGEANAKLLGELRGAEGDARRARYVCELVLIGPEGQELRGTGAAWDGGVRLRPRVHSGRRGADRSRARQRLEVPQLAPSASRRRPASRVPVTVTVTVTVQARPAASSSSAVRRRSMRHQFTSAPKTIAFAIT